MAGFNPNISIQNPADAVRASFGGYGVHYIDAAGDIVSGQHYTHITALEAAVINITVDGTAIASLPIPVGTTIYGDIVVTGWTSGKLWCYKGSLEV